MKTMRKTKTPTRTKTYYITIGTQLQDARDDLQAALVLAGGHGHQTRTKTLWRIIGLLDKVRSDLDQAFYQDGLYEEDPADGIRHPLYTGPQRAAEAARRLKELDDPLLPQDGSEGTDLLPSGWVPVRGLQEMKDMQDIPRSLLVSRFSGPCRVWGRWDVALKYVLHVLHLLHPPLSSPVDLNVAGTRAARSWLGGPELKLSETS